MTKGRKPIQKQKPQTETGAENTSFWNPRTKPDYFTAKVSQTPYKKARPLMQAFYCEVNTPASAAAVTFGVHCGMPVN